MEFKSFIKKALMTVLTLAICIPVIMTVARVNASAEAYVDVQIRYKDAAGNEIATAKPGDQVTIEVEATPKYADGTPISEQMEFFTFDIYCSHAGLNKDNRTATFTIPDPAYDNVSCEILNPTDAINVVTVSGNETDSRWVSLEWRGDLSKGLSVDPLTDRSEASSNQPSDGGNSGSAGGDSGSSESSGSSDSSSAAGGGAAAPAGNGGGAGGNAGATTVSGVYTATSMNSVAITSPIATVATAAGLSEADIAAGTNVRTYICDSRNREVKDVLKAVAETSGRRVVAYIDVDLYTITKAGVVTNVRNTAAPVSITFGLPGSLANAGHAYSIMGLNPDGTTAVFEDIDTNNATVTINATTFGTYAIVINP